MRTNHGRIFAVTSDDEDIETKMRNLYFDILQNGGLGQTLDAAFAHINSPLRVKSDHNDIFSGPLYTRVQRERRFSPVYCGSEERIFLPGFWRNGVSMGTLSTTSIDELARALHAWNFEELLVVEMKKQFPDFKIVQKNASAFEGGTEIEAEWERMLTCLDVKRVWPVVELASKHPRLSQLFPYSSLGRLGFSRSTGYPYTFDLPLIENRGDGIFEISDYEGTVVMARSESAAEIIALYQTHIPDYCTRAISGTAEDLPASDPWHGTADD